MQGSYALVADDGTRFEAEIPAFVLSVPRTLH
jgi:ApaG protein